MVWVMCKQNEHTLFCIVGYMGYRLASPLFICHGLDEYPLDFGEL